MYKRIGNNFYVHKSNIYEILDFFDDLNIDRIKEIEELLPEYFEYEIIKINKNKNKISFISSPDWDYAREPIVGDVYTTNFSDICFKLTKSKGQIYHHKWMFVSDTYNGFDLKKSKEWSDLWTKVIPNSKDIKSRIGYNKYWIEILKEFNLPLD